MKSLKPFKRSRVLLVYHYFLLEENERDFDEFINLQLTLSENDDKFLNDLNWFKDFKSQKEDILEKINNNLKKDWSISRIPALEKSILANAIYEIKNSSFNNEKSYFLIINKAIDFSKKYLDFEKFKYINKVLDIVLKEEIENKKVKLLII
ncbi:MAG: Transcription antitermination protein NusB [Mycoplasmataceae bacterium]|nr:MAG: Transcription antitermination protein NusB [Mycoplasmataceae bacterium]